MSEYSELLAKLAAQRLTLATAKELRTVMIQNFEESPTYQAVQTNINNASNQIGVLTEQLHELALSDFRATGSKKPHPGVGIRVSTKLVYDQGVALDWAKTNLPAALVLDTKTFEAFVKATTVPVTFVSELQIASATIATDLSAYLQEEK
jgi:hypothetical protein